MKPFGYVGATKFPAAKRKRKTALLIAKICGAETPMLRKIQLKHNIHDNMYSEPVPYQSHEAGILQHLRGENGSLAPNEYAGRLLKTKKSSLFQLLKEKKGNKMWKSPCTSGQFPIWINRLTKCFCEARIFISAIEIENKTSRTARLMDVRLIIPGKWKNPSKNDITGEHSPGHCWSFRSFFSERSAAIAKSPSYSHFKSNGIPIR